MIFLILLQLIICREVLSNEEFDEEYFEKIGDMIVAKGALDPPGIFMFKSFTTNVAKWDFEGDFATVLYDITDPELLPKATKAMRNWEEGTCIRFREATETERESKPYVQFVKKENICRAVLGKLRRFYNVFTRKYSPPQFIQVSNKSCSLGSFIHELGHSLGLLHTQMRADRDKYLLILKQNIRKEKLTEFNKLVNKIYNSYDLPYDLTSVLHYNDLAFTDNGNITIKALNPYLQSIVGVNRRGASFLDKTLLNRYYGCIDVWKRKCNIPVPNCMNLGHIDENCECKCPPGTTGELCEVITEHDKNYAYYYADFKPTCMYNVTQIGYNVIKSPGFPNESKAGTTCIYTIIAPSPDYKIVVKFHWFLLISLKDEKRRCGLDHLLIIEDGVSDAIIKCGRDIKQYSSFSFNATKVYLIYRTLTSYSRGFQAVVSFEKKNNN